MRYIQPARRDTPQGPRGTVLVITGVTSVTGLSIAIYGEPVQSLAAALIVISISALVRSFGGH
jgi:hypothetical protein